MPQDPAASASAGVNRNPQPTTANSDIPAVRFSSAVREISPPTDTVPLGNQDGSTSHTEVSSDDLQTVTKSLASQPLQARRINTYQFEPCSLPASRVPSREEDSPAATRLSTPNTPGVLSPHGSPRLAGMSSPPLTPSGSNPSSAIERRQAKAIDKASLHQHPSIITPQQTSSHEKHEDAQRNAEALRPSAAVQRQPLTHRPASSDHVFHRPSSAEEQRKERSDHRRSMFGVGGGSTPVSRDSSPSRASQFYSRPMAAMSDLNDPYAKNRRETQEPQKGSKHTVDARFKFTRRKKPESSHESRTGASDKRGSGIFGTNDSSSTVHASHGSMSDLKRFFRGSHHKKGDSSPAAATPQSTKSGSKTPPVSRTTTQLPFGDDHGLIAKYGKLGRVLGAGAGGSVRLMKRKEDSTVFAVKEFRARHNYESVREYNKKVTAEFCIGSTLHHGNIIETLDIVQEKERWFEVMEYAPFDLFASVMTGKMSREEVTCCFLQIFNGVTYLHSVGLAHRDLKLDNVVVSDKGIMKIIDFGSAHVFKYPFESETNPAKGVVGSDPYLAPEVYESREYDAAAVDIWSLAIIYCCMVLRRFPWKVPRLSDNSFKLFAAEATPGHDPNKLISPAKSPGLDKEFVHNGHTHHHHGHKRDTPEHHKKDEPSQKTSNTAADGSAPPQKEVIRGPWRILRLLPKESRHIIHRMLEMDPKKRATMDEIMQNPWVADSVICQQLEHGEVIHGEDHTHILEPSSSQLPPPKQP